MKNKVPLFTLVFFFVYAIYTNWTVLSKVLVILNALLVLLQTIVQLKEVLSDGRN